MKEIRAEQVESLTYLRNRKDEYDGKVANEGENASKSGRGARAGLLRKGL